MKPHEEHVSCTLDDDGLVERLGEWAELRERLVSVAAIERGARMTLSADAGEVAADLAEREAACCSFLHFDVVDRGDAVILDVTSSTPEGATVIDVLVGRDPRPVAVELTTRSPS